ncbi:hypothetical protein IEQ34_020805 [Dendrobium chrysotoxum]|uniref:Uncharacterized protein n=1 Tax=Dendrobium chrysotoxum TaxID=161865 RepID=A0AAV7G310_DENCH|nr:hypothetical protein IEQ34_020805 [Dendrobium chrysotoxum]
MTYGVSLPQFSCSAMLIIMGLIVLFRDRGAVLSPEYLSQMVHLISDTQGRAGSRLFPIQVVGYSHSESRLLFVQNDWNLQEKWEKLKELPVPLHFGAEDLLKILKLLDIDTLHYEVCYLSRYIDEDYLFKVGLSTQAGRSHAHMLKKSLDRHTDFKLEMTKTLNDWNNEFVKDQIQEAHNHIYDVEVKAFEEGFIRGFIMGVCVVQCKTGAEIEGLTPSQASSNTSSDSDGDEIRYSKEGPEVPSPATCCPLG